MSEHLRRGHVTDSDTTTETFPSASAESTPAAVDNEEPRTLSRRSTILRAVLVVAAIPILGLYIAPRIYDLAVTPSRLDQAVVSAGNYNPALDEIVAQEKITSSAFTALDKMNAALDSVLVTDERVATELTALTGQITGDLQATLDTADANVDVLVTSLDTLTAQIDALSAPVGIADSALASNIDRMTAILTDVRGTAADVHTARLSAQESADDLSGR